MQTLVNYLKCIQSVYSLYQNHKFTKSVRSSGSLFFIGHSAVEVSQVLVLVVVWVL